MTDYLTPAERKELLGRTQGVEDSLQSLIAHAAEADAIMHDLAEALQGHLGWVLEEHWEGVREAKAALARYEAAVKGGST